MRNDNNNKVDKFSIGSENIEYANKSGKSKGQKSAKFQKLSQLKKSKSRKLKKLSKSRNSPNFNAMEVGSSFLTPDIKITFNHL